MIANPVYNPAALDRGQNYNKDVMNAWSATNTGSTLPAIIGKETGDGSRWKPFDEEDVREALSKWNSIRKSPEAQTKNRFMVKMGKLIKTVKAEDVAYFMAEDKYLFLITKDNQSYIIEETIGSLEPQLDRSDFFRINRKFIINIQSIKEMYKLSRNRVRVILMPMPAEGIDVVVSEERAEAFKNWLDQ